MKKLLTFLVAIAAGTSAFGQAAVTRGGASGLAVQQANLVFITPVIGVASGTSLSLSGLIAAATSTASVSYTSPIFSSNNADPADAGIIRLGNGELIAWEASPAGTDVTLTVNSSEQFVFSAAILSPTFITPALGTPVSGVGTNLTDIPTAGLLDGAVTLAKMADLAQDQFIVRTTGSTGPPQTATVTAAARTVLDDTTVGAMVDTLGGATSVGTGGIARGTSPTFSTSIVAGSATMALFNTVATTVNAFGGASTALNMGNASGSTSMLGIIGFDGATPSSSTAAIFPAATTSLSSLRLPHGTAPTSPVNGDLWTTTAGLSARINGSTLTFGSGTGNVTNSGTLTSTAIATGAGTTVIQTPSATTTLDSSGNMAVAGNLTVSGTSGISVSGGSVAGAVTVTEGTAPSLTANAFKIYAPADVAAGGLAYITPAAAATGVMKATNSSGVMTITHDAGVADLASSTSANLRSVLSDENGTGAALFSGASAAALTSPDITTSVTTPSTTIAVFNATATTVNAFGAATTVNTGAAATQIWNFGGSTTASEFRFLEPSGSGTNYSAFKAVAQGANITYSLPATVGAAGTFLRDNAGNGVLDWAGSGNVTNSGTLTSTAIVTGGGTTVVQAPSATSTLDSSGNMSLAGDLTVVGADISVASAGVKLTGSNGSITFLGLGSGADEDLKLDLDTTSNTATFSSSTGVTTAAFGAIGITTTGTSSVGPLVDSVDGTTPLNNLISAYGAGTAYAFTNAAAAIDFGTTDPSITLSNAGTYTIYAQVHVAYAAATVVAETATLTVRRTNNTAADLGQSVVIDLPVSTVLTHSYGIVTLPPFSVTTANTNDALTINANVSATLGAGTINATAVGTSIIAIRRY